MNQIAMTMTTWIAAAIALLFAIGSMLGAEIENMGWDGWTAFLFGSFLDVLTAFW